MLAPLDIIGIVLVLLVALPLWLWGRYWACPKCGRHLAVDAFRCAGCGEKLHSYEYYRTGEFYCSRCGATEMEIGWFDCSNPDCDYMESASDFKERKHGD